MIKCTRNADGICRPAFESNDVSITTIEKILEKIQVDPDLIDPAVEAYIITDEDVKSMRMRNTVEAALRDKHEDSVVIFISRKGKLKYEEGTSGFSACLVKPKPAEVKEAVYKFASSLQSKAVITESAYDTTEEAHVDIPAYQPEFKSVVIPKPEVEESIPVAPEPLPIEPVEVPETIPEPQVDESRNNMAERIKQASKISDVAVLASQLNASKLVKEAINDNHQYAIFENTIKSLDEKIRNIMIDPKVSLEEKLEKVRSVVYDKDYYRAKANTIIEQRMESIIEAITSNSISQLSSRLKEIDEALYRKLSISQDELTYDRLAGITEERANILMELAVLEKEIQNANKAANDITVSLSDKFAIEGAEVTGNPLMDDHLKLRADGFVSKETVDAIASTLMVASKTSEEFEGAVRQIFVMRDKLNKLMDLDKEQIAAYTNIIKYMTSNHIEDTIVAQTLLKKSLRLFIGKEGSGRTVVPMILSSMKSRTNANVLLLDLTGTCKKDDYGVSYYSLEDYLEHRYENQICMVSGQISETAEAAQKLLTALVKAADYYRVINVVIDPSQKNIIDIIGQDALTINYIVEPKNSQLDFMKGFIEETRFDNVAQRVILNRCPVNSGVIIEKLGLLNAMNVHICKLVNIPQVTECGVRGVQPFTIDSIVTEFGEVSKHA